MNSPSYDDHLRALNDEIAAAIRALQKAMADSADPKALDTFEKENLRAKSGGEQVGAHGRDSTADELRGAVERLKGLMDDLVQQSQEGVLCFVFCALCFVFV